MPPPNQCDRREVEREKEREREREREKVSTNAAGLTNVIGHELIEFVARILPA